MYALGGILSVKASASCATDFFQVESYLNLIVAREEEQA